MKQKPYKAISNLTSKYLVILFCHIFFQFNTIAQDSLANSKFTLKNLKPIFVAQTWVRLLDHNPGTTINGHLTASTIDFSIRRYRFGISGLITPKIYLYTVVGENNLNFNSDRGNAFALLDLVSEYRFNDKIHIGVGKSSWKGTSRYATPSTSKMLTMDIPLVSIPTINEGDHILRRVGVYAKGKVQKIDYRFAITSPFTKNDITPTIETNRSHFSNYGGDLNYAGYVKYEFFEGDPNNSPYLLGTYLGKKKVMNIGAGFEFQPKATWYKSTNGDTLFSDMFLPGIDFFLELPLNEIKQNAVTFYIVGLFYDFGKNYIRNIGINNIGNGTNEESSFNGQGNAYPAIGTGNSIYTQLGYLFPKFDTKGNKGGQLQLFAATQYSKYDYLNEAVQLYEYGFNWYLNEQRSKFSLGIQNRPIFNFDLDESDRKNQFVLQYHFRIE